MASDVVLKVRGDVKDAARKLKELGAEVELVETKTKKAQQAQDLWDKTIQKGSDDSIKSLVNLGAKYLSIASAATLAIKGIKACVSEALKVNEEAAKTVKNVDDAWNEIKANLGTRLLDTVSPALKELYGWLLKISDWQKGTNEQISNRNDLLALAENTSNASSIVTQYSKSQVFEAMDFAYNQLENGGGKKYKNLYNNLREILDNYDYIITQLGAADNEAARGREAMVEHLPTYARPLFAWDIEWFKSNFTQPNPTNAGRDFNGVNPLKYGAPRVLSNPATGNWSPSTVFADRPGLPFSYMGVGGMQSSIDMYAELLNKKMKEEEEKRFAELDERYGSHGALAESLEAWDNYYSTITEHAQNAFSAISDMRNAMYEEEIRQIEDSEMSEEEKADKIDEIQRKQFLANKMNSISQVAIDTASAIMNIWSAHAKNPVMASVLTGLATATSAAQIGTISAQKYHAFAEGGIVSGPTHALIGEGGEKEAVLPLSKLKDFVADTRGAGTINITVNVTDGSRRGDIANEVYFAIERAQRTGALPKWRYA